MTSKKKPRKIIRWHRIDDPIIQNEILDLLSLGYTMKAVGQIKGLPSRTVIYKKMRKDPEFEREVNKARAAGQIEQIDRCVEIADNTKFPEDVPISKLQIEVRQWRAERLNSKQLGNKQRIVGDLNDDPIKVEDGSYERISSRIDKLAQSRRVQENSSGDDE